MRVVAGIFRGRPLVAPPGLNTRPITDRVKETLFNVLGARFCCPGQLPDFAVADLFAGTGGLGIEALSRGAETCVFVERERRALRALRANLDKLGVGERTTVLAENAWSMRPPEVPGGFGLIFIDPPYRDAEDTLRVSDLLEAMAPSLRADGLIVFRHEARAAFPSDQLRTLRVADDRRYGRMHLVFLEKEDTKARRHEGT
jgi:16S rRNA (guanine966-N2)-methyltransferase